MLIFGGESTKTFVFDTRKVDLDTRKAIVTTSNGTLDRKSKFGFRSDYVARTINTIFYAIDANEQVIHSHEMSSLEWFSQPISEFGFNE